MIETKVAIYCRLSREDVERGQSESIKNQKNSLTKYAQEKNWSIVDTYIDDGYSGTNFERPEFQRMIEDIKKGLINCVITKDYSRLGREHIQTSHYTEIFFPQHRVRYIAVNDGIDTRKEDDLLSIRAVFNDMYARDISKKIRYTLRNKQKEGAFIGAFAPYGYKKDPGDNNKLLIDPLTAPIIQEIFQLYLAGHGKSRIATILNQRGIPSPASTKSNYRNSQRRNFLWNPLTIKRILENEVYLGHTLQHKKEKVSYKVTKQINLPKESWIKVENTHLPIIETGIFNEVQKIIEERKSKGYFIGKNPGLFSGLVKCGLCDSNYVYYRDKKYGRVLICGAYKRYYSRGCQKKILLESQLEELILEDLKLLTSKSINKKVLTAKLLDTIQEEKSYSEKKLEFLQKSLEIIKIKLITLYEDKLNGLLEEEQYLFFKDKLRKETSIIEEKIKLFNRISENGVHLTRAEKLLKDFLSFTRLDREVVLKLIDRIQIFPQQRIKILYKFKGLS